METGEKPVRFRHCKGRAVFKMSLKHAVISALWEGGNCQDARVRRHAFAVNVAIVSEEYRGFRSGKNGLQLIFSMKRLAAILLCRNNRREVWKLSDREKTDEGLKLTDKEKKLLSIIRGMQFGEVRVVVTDGIPTRAEEIKKSVKL